MVYKIKKLSTRYVQNKFSRRNANCGYTRIKSFLFLMYQMYFRARSYLQYYICGSKQNFIKL